MSSDRMDAPPVLVGQSPRIRQILELIQKLGRSRVPVLLLGETGTGKEVVARAIHAVRNVGPFVPIDCSALSGPLLESELFGHVRGAFTGAVTAKTGLVELADGGTAFFDEIGELPVELQTKLLRLLQEKEFRPVGSVTRRKADFRVIAATNQDLAQAVERGTFRRDLYYRLSVVNLRLPPLRERKEDIPLLANHFLARYGNNHTLTRECLEAMLSYDWPGNVRELENAIQRMVAINSGPLLHTADLPSAIQHHLEARKAERLSAAACGSARSLGHLAERVANRGGEAGAAAEGLWFDPPRRSPTGDGRAERGASHRDQLPLFGDSSRGFAAPEGILPMAELERRAILHALEYTKGDRVMAAHLLGIGRTTLYRKLKEYRITE
ncbi:MAG: sigma-54 dependent transcriptional regulator [Bryobacterales bacterium]|nr:sigma-54 dependent transcriptional regulator [Bryobacteraceae bacterium]MDW8353294.1 sigma-54 dependent transcriptional regulator [Bryobacterales bacterium]